MPDTDALALAAALREIWELTASGNPDPLDVLGQIQDICREVLGDA